MLSRQDIEAILQAAEKEGAEGLKRYQELLNQKDYAGDTPLHLALRNGREAAAKALIAAKADVHAVGTSGYTTLHLAAFNGSVSMVTLLLKAGVPIDARKDDKDTPLLLAVFCARDGVAKALIAAKADVRAVNANRRTPLHYAASQGLVSVVSLLLEKGAQVDARDCLLDPPLHLALCRGQEGAAKALIAAKADIQAGGENGITPLHLAAQKNLSSLVLLLLEKGALWDFEEEYNIDAYRLLKIYSVIQPCFAASNLLWLAKCIEALYLAGKPDPLFNQQADLKTFFENNFQKIEALFFERHAGALQEAEKILSLPQVAIRKFLTPVLLKHIRELYFTVRKPEIFWEPFLGALALQNADCQLLEQSMPDIQNQHARMQKPLSHNALPDALSIIALEYLGWVTCSPSPTQEDQKLRGEINRMLGQNAPDLGLHLYNTQFALCRAHFHRLNTGKGQQSLDFAEILDSPGRLLPAFEMRRRDKGQQQQQQQKQKDEAGPGQDPKPTPKAEPKPAPGAAAPSAQQ